MKPLFFLTLLLWAAPTLAAGPVCNPAWGVALDGYPITAERLDLVKAETGLAPRLVSLFLQWPPPGQAGESPVASLEAITNAGGLPVLTLEPMYLEADGKERAAPAADILSGAYDPYLTALARDLKVWGKPLIIRFAHEMNLERYHWGTGREAYGPQSPDIYRRIYRHVVSVVRGQGASNVRWAFCPNAESLPHPRWHKAAWNTASAYWPGREFVDVLGMDGYNWGTSRTQKEHGWQSRWLSFKGIFQELREELTALAPDKPVLVFETSCALDGGDRAQWLGEALAEARKWNLKALIWFQAAKEVDWRLMAERDRRALELMRAPAGCDRNQADLLKSLGFSLP